MVHNALAAAAVGLVDGLTVPEVAEALTEAPANVRFSVHPGINGSTIIDDTYNASPASMLAALDLLAEAPGRKIAVLGDMRELGDAEAEGHREVGERAGVIADVVVAVGELGRVIGEAAARAGTGDVRVAEEAAKVAAIIGPMLGEGDVVLVKASRAL